MKIISWNVNGLGNQKKNSSIKNLLRKFQPEIILLQETKKEEITANCISSFWAVRDRKWIFTPSFDSSGGLLIAWRSDKFDDIQVEYGIFFLSVKLQDKQVKDQWWITCIYGPPLNMGKLEFWTELNDIGNLVLGPWCVGGDFNEILFPSDRKGQSRITRNSKCFHDWIAEFALIDLPLPNLQHTWSNFRINASCSKIDRFFISKD